MRYQTLNWCPLRFMFTLPWPQNWKHDRQKSTEFLKHCQRHSRPKGWVHLSKVTYWVTHKFTDQASKSPLQVALGPHQLRRTWSQFKACSRCPSQSTKKYFWVGILISILSTHKKFWFRNVPHHFQIICTFAICQEFDNLYKLWWTAYTTCFNLFTAFSSWCENIKQLVSFIAIKSTKQESVSQSVSESVTEKHSQWSDSGPIIMQ